MTNSMDCIFVKTKDKTITLKKFLKTDASTLNEAEQKIQAALVYLYKKITKNHLYLKSFLTEGRKN